VPRDNPVHEMTNAQIIARITKLAPVAPVLAQREADIAIRSAASTRSLNQISAACAALGLRTDGGYRVVGHCVKRYI
jgi:hypothetical protein